MIESISAFSLFCQFCQETFWDRNDRNVFRHLAFSVNFFKKLYSQTAFIIDTFWDRNDRKYFGFEPFLSI